MRNGGFLWLALLAIPMLLSGCQLMPEEEELPAAPPMYTYEAEEYRQTTVMRGDLVKTTNVYCTYVAVRKENLAFPVGGLYVEQVYVTEGQQVKAGQLLATLEQTDLQEQISEREYQLEVLRLKKTHILENLELALAECDVLWEGDRRVQKRAEVEADYARQLQEIEDSIYIQELLLQEQKDGLRERQIFAGIDGTVTYVKTVTEGLRSVKDESFVTVKDFDSAVFQVKGEDTAYFRVGDQVTFTSQKNEYTATVIDPSVLGLEQSDEQIVYLRLSQPDPGLEDGKKGTIVITLDQRSDVLYVDKKAVRTANGEPFVYMLNADGLRVVQKIATGLDAGDVIEITEGLTEGDKVILE